MTMALTGQNDPELVDRSVILLVRNTKLGHHE